MSTLNISANRLREPNLYLVEHALTVAPARTRRRVATRRERQSIQESWRCANPHCREWTAPSKAAIAGTCHACGTARPVA